MADFSLIFKLCTYSLKMFIPYRSKYANLFDSIELKKVSLILYLSEKSVKGINRDFKLSQIQRKTRNVTQTEERTESIGCCFFPIVPYVDSCSFWKLVLDASAHAGLYTYSTESYSGTREIAEFISQIIPLLIHYSVHGFCVLWRGNYFLDISRFLRSYKSSALEKGIDQ